LSTLCSKYSDLTTSVLSREGANCLRDGGRRAVAAGVVGVGELVAGRAVSDISAPPPGGDGAPPSSFVTWFICDYLKEASLQW
jgi:hypothetical protein